MIYLQFSLWNIKGIKSSRKKKFFWNEVKKEKEIEMWTIQEHQLDARSPGKQWFGRRLVFYGEGVNGFKGVFSIVKQEMEPRVVYNHHSRRGLGVSIKWDSQ